MTRRQQDAADQVDGRSLAIGAGDADDFQPLARITGEHLADAAESVTAINRIADRQSAIADGPFGQNGGSAAGDSVGDEVVPIMLAAAEGDEQIAGPAASRVAGAAR